MLLSTTLWIILIVFLSILMKVFANVYHYKYDVAWHHMNDTYLKYGKLYHWFDFFALIIPFFITLVVKFTILKFILFLLSFLLIYSFEMSFLFNIFSGRNWFYVGKTETTDIWLRKVLNLHYISDNDYHNLSPKEKQTANFRAALLYFIRLLFALIGCVIIEYI